MEEAEDREDRGEEGTTELAEDVHTDTSEWM
jgi:hypothetical protein